MMMMMMMITNQILVSVVLCVFVSTILDGVNDFIFYLFFLLSFLFDKDSLLKRLLNTSFDYNFEADASTAICRSALLLSIPVASTS